MKKRYIIFITLFSLIINGCSGTGPDPQETFPSTYHQFSFSNTTDVQYSATLCSIYNGAFINNSETNAICEGSSNGTTYSISDKDGYIIVTYESPYNQFDFDSYSSDTIHSYRLDVFVTQNNATIKKSLVGWSQSDISLSDTDIVYYGLGEFSENNVVSTFANGTDFEYYYIDIDDSSNVTLTIGNNSL